MTSFSLKKSMKRHVCLESLSCISPRKPVFLLLTFPCLNKGVLVPQDKEYAPSLPAPRAPGAPLSRRCNVCGPGGEDRSSWSPSSPWQTPRGLLWGSLWQNNLGVTMRAASQQRSRTVLWFCKGYRPPLGRLTGLAWETGLPPAHVWLKLTASSAV